MKELTPLMRQYWEIKDLHRDKVLLFRMGDFYEMFHDDAVLAAPILGIALTSRNKKSLDETPMCGVPHHSIAGPINKLLQSGKKVAVCEQIEDPKHAKGIVKRAVTRIYTPGMVLDPDSLEASKAHYIACVENSCFAAIDVSTGECFYYSHLTDADIQRLLRLLPVAEVVVADERESEKNLNLKNNFDFVISQHSKTVNSSHFLVGGTNEKSVLRLLSYVETQSGNDNKLSLRSFEQRSLTAKMRISESTIRHLEVFNTYKGDVQGSFFQAFQRTQTSVGSRLLRQWLLFPLCDNSEIAHRQDLIENWISCSTELKRVRQILREMGDLERRLSKIGQNSVNPRDLQSLRDSILIAIQALNLEKNIFPNRNTDFDFSVLSLLADEIDDTLVDEPPVNPRAGGIIRKGFSSELDAVIELATNSQSLLFEMEQREKSQTGISSLKIRYNQVFGYYIEVTNTHKDKVPSHYLRKQTLANAERFCTDELIELEKKVLSAQSRRQDLEFETFTTLKDKLLSNGNLILRLSNIIANLDAITSLSWLAIECRLCRPKLVASPGELFIKSSRHLVVEQNKKDFVSNDIFVESGGCLLLTGPNMAGKSTLMRQVALTALMAQIGSFVPASEANIPIFDQIYTRIGASDQLSEGLSTFMVEMTETAEILKSMTDKSLIVFDEIGRGTSTFDGMSLAQAILEFLVSEKRATCFFATHYFELTKLSDKFSQIKNAHMAIVENKSKDSQHSKLDIQFLYTLMKGPAKKSYGIQVARLAGLPAGLTDRAQALLADLEKEKTEGSQQMTFSFDEVSFDKTLDNNTDNFNNNHDTQVKILLAEKINQIKEKYNWLTSDLEKWPIQNKTPLDAMNQIAIWQKMILSELSNSSH